MPELNSFCVIVTDKENKVMFWNRPTDLDSARLLYNQKCAEFNREAEKQPPHQFFGDRVTGEMYSGMVFELHDAYTNKGIEKKIKEWRGDMTIPVAMATNISYKFENRITGYTIQLLHSSKT